jgi:GNAT superfamily N-acetyltransferase
LTETTTIRPATYADVDVIARMAHRFVTESPYVLRMPADLEHVKRLVHFFVGQGGAFLAGDAQAPVGVIVLTLFPHYVLNVIVAGEVIVWVDPSVRALGVGRALFQAAEAWAKSRGAVKMQATALKNPDAERWYTNRGYTAQEVIFEKDL